MNDQAPSKLQVIDKMRYAYVEKDQARFESCFTDDLYYRVGTAKELRGPGALWDYFNEIYGLVTIDKMDPVGIWDTEDTVIAEYDQKITYVASGKSVEYPCVDIYQFRDGKISAWRVYPIHISFVAMKESDFS